MTAQEFKQHERRIELSTAVECLGRAFEHLAQRSRRMQPYPGEQWIGEQWTDRGDHLAALIIARCCNQVGSEEVAARVAEIRKTSGGSK